MISLETWKGQLKGNQCAAVESQPLESDDQRCVLFDWTVRFEETITGFLLDVLRKILQKCFS